MTFPSELTDRPRWVCWRGVMRDGKLTKVPVDPKTGQNARSNDPATWATYEVASREARKYSGIGYMLGDGIFGVDLDHVDDAITAYNSGSGTGIVADFLTRLGSYAELSQSGTGVHILCAGHLPEGARRKGPVEMYDAGRFFVMTGHSLPLGAPPAPLIDCTESIKPLHAKYLGGEAPKPRQPFTIQYEPDAPDMSDDQVLARMLQGRSGDLLGQLYAGQWYGTYPSQSEADMRLCNGLAFYTRRDPVQMDRMFRSSGLMRPKWDVVHTRGQTYGQATITTAIRDCAQVWEPERPKPSPENAAPFYSLDDTGNAELFADRCRGLYVYDYTNRRWVFWDKKVWHEDDSGEIMKAIDNVVEQLGRDLEYKAQLAEAEYEADRAKALRKHAKQSRGRNAHKAMEELSRHRLPATADKWNVDKWLLNTQSGVLDLRSGDLLPHTAEAMHRHITDAEYTTHADRPVWDAFINQIFSEDAELISYVQRAVGYSLTGDTREQVFFLCYGNGANGKSVFLDTIADALGSYAINVQPDTLMARQSNGSGPTGDVARINGARMVTSEETTEGVRLNESFLKQLTGGGKVTARVAYGDDFEFTPTCKLWMTANHLPIIRGTDVGIWRRIRVIPFTVEIPEEKRDKELRSKLAKELPAILAWAMEGCLAWQRDGLGRCKAVEAASGEYRQDMDVVQMYLDERTMRGPYTVQASELYRDYVEWAREGNMYTMSMQKFGREIGKRFQKDRPANGNGYIYRGLAVQSRAPTPWRV